MLSEQLKQLKENQLNDMKTKIVDRLRTIKREGIDDLIKYLAEESDYFTAPASTKFHNNMDGGLAVHSDNVVELLLKKNEQFNLGLAKETVYLVGYMHDLCKCNFYQKSLRLKKDEKSNKWISQSSYDIVDTFPFGHGEKSVSILQDYIKLTMEEKLLIRYHMGLGIAKDSYQDLNKAILIYPAIVALHTSDYEASALLEEIYEPTLYTADDYNNFKAGRLEL